MQVADEKRKETISFPVRGLLPVTVEVQTFSAAAVLPPPAAPPAASALVVRPPCYLPPPLTLSLPLRRRHDPGRSLTPEPFQSSSGRPTAPWAGGGECPGAAGAAGAAARGAHPAWRPLTGVRPDSPLPGLPWVRAAPGRESVEPRALRFRRPSDTVCD